MENYSIPAACAAIANAAAVRVEFAGESVPTAVTAAARDMASDAQAARMRTGRFAATLTAEDAELWGLYGSVAQDVIHGGVARPSTGNVLDYVVRLTREYVAA